MGKRKIECPKDTWVKLIFDFGKGFPEEYRISFETRDGKPVSGTYEEQRFIGIYPQAVTLGKLKNQMRFRRYWINGIYKVKVRTTADTVAYIEGRMRFKVLIFIFILILCLFVLIISLI
jgi:hypothetical protein